jgi:hypothetical protein
MPIANLAELRTRIDLRLGRIESERLQPTVEALEESCRSALAELSAIRPRSVVRELAGDGSSRRYVLTTAFADPDGWVADSSDVLEIGEVSNTGTDDETVDPLGEDDWAIRRGTDGLEVLFVGTPVGVDRVLRIRYSRAHTVTDLDGAAATTVPERETEALVLLATSEAAGWIARTAADLADRGSLGVDQIEFAGFSRRWREFSDVLRKRAAERLGASELVSGGAGTSVEWESESRLGRLPRVSH